MDRYTVPQLIAPHAPTEGKQALTGDVAGRCYICALDTEQGQRRPPSDMFTAWASCAQGDVLCPDCARTLNWRDVRMFSWLATPEGVRFEGRGDRQWLWDVLMDPPDPPFAVYVTQGGQKQGWISGARQVTTSVWSMAILTDWTDRPVILKDEDRLRYGDLILRLRGRKVSRKVLISGEAPPGLWAKAIKEGWGDDLRLALTYAGDPRWDVMVSVSNGPNTDAPAGADLVGAVTRVGLPLG